MAKNKSDKEKDVENGDDLKTPLDWMKAKQKTVDEANGK